MSQLNASSAETLPPGPWPAAGCLDEEQVLALLDRRLPAHLQAQVEAHVDGCPLCRSLIRFVAQDDETLASHNRREAPVAAGQMIDHFMVRRFIGRGGMGEIYQAFDTTLKRRVALKLIAAELVESEALRERFLHEARATARFSHPSIVAIHSIGEFRGRPYLALEYIEGETLRAHLGQRHLEVHEALGITLAIAEALREAHHHRVLHRDLKPDNVMIGDDGRVHVLDFGLAKLRPVPVEMRSIASALSPAPPSAEGEGEAVELCGTPAYMAPEQWRGQGVSEATDVWALGLLLYEMLAGQRPYQSDAAVDVALRVCSGEPVPPLPPHCAASPALAELVAACLDKDAARRPSAEAVVARLRDLQGERPARVLEQLEAAAQAWERSGRQPASLWDSAMVTRAQQLLEEHALPLPAAATRFLTTSMGQVRRQEQARRLRLRILVGVTALSALLALIFAALALREMQRVRRSQERAERERALALAEGAASALRRGRLLEARAKLRSAIELDDTAQTRLLWWDLQGRPALWTRTLGTGVFDVELAPDGQRVAAAGQDRTVYLIDVDTMALRGLRGHGDQVFELAFSPDGQQLASASWAGEIRLWDLAGAGVRVLARDAGRIVQLAFHPHRPLLLAVRGDGEVQLWPLVGGDAPRAWNAAATRTRALALSPDGERLLTAGDTALALWRFEPPVLEASLEAPGEGAWTSVLLEPGAGLLGAGRSDGSIALWPYPPTGPPRLLRGHGAGVHRVALDRTGPRLLSASQDQTLRLWDLGTGASAVLSPHSGWNLGLSVDARRPLAASAGSDRSVTLWQLARPARTQTEQGHVDGVTAVRFADGGRTVLSTGYDGTLRVWERGSGRLERTLRGPLGAVYALDVAADGSRWVAGGRDRSIWVWDAAQGSVLRTLGGHDGAISDLRLAPDGSTLASASYDGSVRTWELSSGRELRALRGHRGAVFAVAWAAAGRALVSTGADGSVRWWDLAAGAGNARVLTTREQPVRGLAIARRGDGIALAGDDGQVLWLDGPDAMPRPLGQHQGRAYAVDIAPDLRTVASAGADGRVQLWSLAGLPARELVRQDSEVNALRFSDDGAWLLTAADDGTVRLWDLAGGAPAWHAALLWTDPPMLATRQGWRALDAAAGAGRPELARWTDPLLRTARHAAVDPAGTILCALLDGGQLAAWRLADAQRLFEIDAAGGRAVHARADGCLALVGDEVRAVSSEGSERTLRTGVSALAPGSTGDEIVMAAGDQLFVHGAQGQPPLALPIEAGVTALAARGSQVLLGYANGSVELLDRRDGGRGRTATVLEGAPSSAVTALAFGPMGTWLAGFGSGAFGTWDARSGALLLDAQLHGPVRHLAVDDGQVLVASELGSVLGPVDVFTLPRCALLRQVQEDIPVRWREGLVERAPEISACP